MFVAKRRKGCTLYYMSIDLWLVIAVDLSASSGRVDGQETSPLTHGTGIFTQFSWTTVFCAVLVVVALQEQTRDTPVSPESVGGGGSSP